MRNEPEKAHLSAEEIQALLEGDLPEGEVARVRGHADRCARCTSELQAWQTFMQELDELPLLEPSVDFSSRVLEHVPVRRSALARLRDRVRSLVGRRRESRHPAPGLLQEYAEGILSGRKLRGLEGHLAACTSCRSEAEEWGAVMSSLSALPQLDPGPAFADAVLARVELAPVPARRKRLSWDRALGALDRLVPTNPRGWGIAGGVAAAPVAAFVALVGYVATHPVLSLTDLAIFAWWQVSEAASFASAWATGILLEQQLTAQIWALTQSAIQAPGWTAGALVAGWIASAAAGWVLYRNVIAPPDTAGRHVHA